MQLCTARCRSCAFSDASQTYMCCRWAGAGRGAAAWDPGSGQAPPQAQATPTTSPDHTPGFRPHPPLAQAPPISPDHTYPQPRPHPLGSAISLAQAQPTLVPGSAHRPKPHPLKTRPHPQLRPHPLPAEAQAPGRPPLPPSSLPSPVSQPRLISLLLTAPPQEKESFLSFVADTPLLLKAL